MASQCDDGQGNIPLQVSTDNPEDTFTKFYGFKTSQTTVVFDDRPDLAQFIFPPVHVSFPSVPVAPPYVRVHGPILCLIRKPS